MTFSPKHSNRLSRKFIFGVVIILLLTLAGTLFINSRLVERYYLHQQRESVRQTGIMLKEQLEAGTMPQDAIAEVEKTENVLIVYSAKTENPDALSNELRDAFRQKGLGFQKFWLWDQDYERTIQNGSQFRLYSQDKMNYSILVQYLSVGLNLYAIAAIVPNAGGFIKIINQFGFLLYSISILVSIILIYLFARQITMPLTKIQAFTKKLSTRQYEPLKIKTGDELEDVANSLNEMGYEIEQYQKLLEAKNRQMEQLLSDVAHDIKTPISLVGMYASGIQDGMDDGTFLDTIIRQNQRMSQITENLLRLSRIGQAEHPCSEIRPDLLLSQCIDEHSIFFEERGLSLQKRIQSGLTITGNEKLLTELFSNLLSNAAKYASAGQVEIVLGQKGPDFVFLISNEFDNTGLDPERIWEPFYIGEPSRNHALSGTGLGLSIVKKIAEQSGYSVLCRLDGKRIIFEVTLSHKCNMDSLYSDRT